MIQENIKYGTDPRKVHYGNVISDLQEFFDSL